MMQQHQKDNIFTDKKETCVILNLNWQYEEENKKIVKCIRKFDTLKIDFILMALTFSK